MGLLNFAAFRRPEGPGVHMRKYVRARNEPFFHEMPADALRLCFAFARNIHEDYIGHGIHYTAENVR